MPSEGRESPDTCRDHAVHQGIDIPRSPKYAEFPVTSLICADIYRLKSMTTSVNSPLRSCFFRHMRWLAIGIAACCSANLAMAEDLPATAKPVDGLTLPDLDVRQDEHRLYFVVPAGNSTPAKISVPRLGNVVKSIRWIGEDKASMQVKSEPAEWSIDVSPQPANSAAVVVAELPPPCRSKIYCVY